jgi:DNA-directed RNA polymerase delta subunit
MREWRERNWMKLDEIEKNEKKMQPVVWVYIKSI